MDNTRPNRKELLAFAGEYDSTVTDRSPIKELGGGSLNFVWRIQGTSGKFDAGNNVR
jgi:hypothetical protein